MSEMVRLFSPARKWLWRNLLCGHKYFEADTTAPAVLPSIICLMRTSIWNVQFFLKLVGNTLQSFLETNVEIMSICCICSVQDTPWSDKHLKDCSSLSTAASCSQKSVFSGYRQAFSSRAKSKLTPYLISHKSNRKQIGL